MNIKLFPYIGLFTNNIYDIRGLEFFEIYKNDKKKLYEIENNKKILKREYSKLFIDGYRFLKVILIKIQFKDKFNPIIQKWTFEFFSNFIDFDKYKLENVFINYENDYDTINEILQKLGNNNLEEFILKKFLIDICNFLKEILNEFDYYTDKDNNKVEIKNFKNDLELQNLFNLKDNDFNSFYGNKSIYQISKINNQLNKKYALYFKILRNNKYEIIEIDQEFKKKIKFNTCFATKLNIENKKCENLLINVILEKGYGPYSKELFENDENFIVYDKPNSTKKLNYGNMEIIMLLLNKLKFKIKLIYIESLAHGIDNYNVKSLNFNPNNSYYSFETKYLKYYENFENWELNQNISKKLNNQPHLRLYLNNCIEIINRRVTYLNPQFDDFEQFTKLIFLDNDFKHSFKKLENLIKKYQNIEFNKILKILKDQKNYANKLIPENRSIINNNYINNLGMVKTLLNNPTKRNLKLLTSILNSSYKFHKSLFEF